MATKRSQSSTANKGFASMDPAKQKAIASKGGRASGKSRREHSSDQQGSGRKASHR